jgi:hypothetical protein
VAKWIPNWRSWQAGHCCWWRCWWGWMMTRKPLILVNDDGWLDSSLQKKTNWNMNSHWNKVNNTSMPCTVWLHANFSCARHKSKFYKLLNRDVPFITAPRIILINSKLFTCYVNYIKLSRRQEKTRPTRHKDQIFLIFCVVSFFVGKRNILCPQ